MDTVWLYASGWGRPVEQWAATRGLKMCLIPSSDLKCGVFKLTGTVRSSFFAASDGSSLAALQQGDTGSRWNLIRESGLQLRTCLSASAALLQRISTTENTRASHWGGFPTINANTNVSSNWITLCWLFVLHKCEGINSAEQGVKAQLSAKDLSRYCHPVLTNIRKWSSCHSVSKMGDSAWNPIFLGESIYGTWL